jgi:hypothetical protein
MDLTMLSSVMSANLLQFTPHFITETTQVQLYFNKYFPLTLTKPARRYQSNIKQSNRTNKAATSEHHFQRLKIIPLIEACCEGTIMISTLRLLRQVQNQAV